MLKPILYESSNEHLLHLMCCQEQLFIRLGSLCRPVWSHCRLPGQWVVALWTDPLLCRKGCEVLRSSWGSCSVVGSIGMYLIQV